SQLCAPSSSLFPYTTLFRSSDFLQYRKLSMVLGFRLDGNPLISLLFFKDLLIHLSGWGGLLEELLDRQMSSHLSEVSRLCRFLPDRKSTRLNSSHVKISYAV